MGSRAATAETAVARERRAKETTLTIVVMRRKERERWGRKVKLFGLGVRSCWTKESK
jgi:hypothetical protein